ncbi:hypothetical protein DITRI_Ditri14bG0028200 [Diplodiscus trichospermus]
MARGSSQSQSSTSSATSRPGVMAPRGSAASTAGMRRRKLMAGSSSASASGSVGSGKQHAPILHRRCSRLEDLAYRCPSHESLLHRLRHRSPCFRKAISRQSRSWTVSSDLNSYLFIRISHRFLSR